MGKGYLTKYLRKLGCGGQNGMKKFRLYCHSFTLYSIFLFDIPSILAASFLLPWVIWSVFCMISFSASFNEIPTGILITDISSLSGTTFSGRCSSEIVFFLQRTIARSTTFSSYLTFPGQ